MNVNGRKHSPQFRLFLRGLQSIALLGMGYCAVMIVREGSMVDWRLMLYATWFAVALASAEALLQWFKMGVYTLVGMTLLVGVVDIFSGLATAGGFVLMLALLFIIMQYVMPEWWQFE